MQDIRTLVYNSLLSCLENERYSNLEADTIIKRYSLTDRDRSFYTALLYGIIEKQITIDHQIKKLSKTPIEKLQSSVLILLRMGMYQLLFMDGVPDRAAINETVALAKERVNKGAVGYINGMLRSAQRELKKPDGTLSLLAPSRERDLCGHLSITYSYPRFLCKLWVESYGAEKAEKIMLAQNERSHTTIRVNTLEISRDAYLNKLDKLGIKAEPSESTADGIHLFGNAAVTSLPDFENGAFFVQDDSSRMCVEALDPQKGDSVLDACACPGGKSFATAIKMQNSGKIISCDLHESKLPLISEGARRLGIGIITPMQADGSIYNAEWTEGFDKVLCDVPCSGFGTISKKPDLRHKNAKITTDLVNIQIDIVNNCAKYVKRGGTLVYSTCTLNPKENEENVQRFLEGAKDFTLVSMTTCFPFEGKYDGFFFAKMIKK